MVVYLGPAGASTTQNTICFLSSLVFVFADFLEYVIVLLLMLVFMISTVLQVLSRGVTFLLGLYITAKTFSDIPGLLGVCLVLQQLSFLP